MTQGTVGGEDVHRLIRMAALTAPGRRHWVLELVAAVLLGLSWTGNGHGAPGALDPTFGTQGLVTTDFGGFSSISAMILQPDGKIVVGGSSTGANPMGTFALARYQPDGSLDTTFGSGGVVTTDLGSSDRITALVLQPDDTLVAAGTSHRSEFEPVSSRLARYAPDGRLDPTFGDAGVVTVALAGWSQIIANALIRQPDGALVMAGSASACPPCAGPTNALLVRFQPDGRLDPTFGTGGVVATDFGGDGDGISALVLQPDGRLVAAGSANGNFALARYQPDGQLDAAFGTGGLVTTDVGGSVDGISALVLQPDGRLVAAGSAGFPGGPQVFALARYQPDGRLDATFGTGGVVTTDVGGGPGEIAALVRQPDGRLVAAGSAGERGGARVFALARYQPDGRLDAAFGSGGVVTTDFGGSSQWIGALVLQPNSRLVAGGTAMFSDTQGFALARYQTLDVDGLAAFVTEVYQAALARIPDAGEEAYWVEVLATEPTADTVRGMLHVVFDGPEFRQRPVNPWQYVDALYRAMLGRAPDQAELDWWVQAVLDHLNTLLPEFLDSPEFQHLVPSCQDQAAVTLLVGRLYQHVLKRVPSWEEVDWWTAEIIMWCALHDAVEVFFNSLEYLSEPHTLADHVTVVYRALLAHEPDAGGLAWWVDDLAGQLATIEDDVMASPEFEARVDRLFP